MTMIGKWPAFSLENPSFTFTYCQLASRALRSREPLSLLQPGRRLLCLGFYSQATLVQTQTASVDLF